MKLYEFLDQEALNTAYYDPSEDKLNVRKPSDSRRKVLTLRALNRLKRLRAYQKLEDLKRMDLLAVMYGQPEEDAGGMGMGGPPGF